MSIAGITELAGRLNISHGHLRRVLIGERVAGEKLEDSLGKYGVNFDKEGYATHESVFGKDTQLK